MTLLNFDPRLTMDIKSLPYFLILVLTFLLAACGSEEAPPEKSNCDISIFKSSLDSKSNTNRYIVSIEQKVEAYTITFDDGSTIDICAEAIISYQYLLEEWEVEFTFSDQTSFLADSKGMIAVDFQIDPFGRNPLCALANVTSQRDGKVKINVIGKNGTASDLIHEFDDIGSNLEIPIFGLYQDHLNEVEIKFLSQNNAVVDVDTLLIQTQKVASISPQIDIIKADRSNMEPREFHLVSSLSYWGPNIAYMFDSYGEIRWLINYKDSEVLNNLFFDVGMEQLQNGNLYFGDKITNTIYEVDFFGTIIDSWPLSTYTFHHHVQEKPDGNFLLTVNLPSSVHNNGKNTKEDYIIEIDRSTKDIVKVWDFKQLLDEDRNALGDWGEESPVDWIHINAVVYSESDNSIIVSGRNQGLAKVDYDDNVKWILAPHMDWGQNRKGQDCNAFLLTALNSANEAYSLDVQNGNTTATDFDWSWYQHAPFLMPNGNLMVFDNGLNRNFDSSAEEYSRAVEYAIDEGNMTLRQVWQYGKNRGQETYASVLSDVDYLPVTGNILFCPGYKVFNEADVDGGRVIEVDYKSKEVYFEAFIGSPGLTFHRVERMSFY